MIFHTSKESVIQNLEDAGCSNDMIEEYISDLENGKTVLGEILLTQHRRNLLENLHKEQKKIDCLDYLLYMMKKQKQASK